MQILMTHPQITLISDISSLNIHSVETAECGEELFIIILYIFLYFIISYILSKSHFTEYPLVSYCLLVLFAS